MPPFPSPVPHCYYMQSEKVAHRADHYSIRCSRAYSPSFSSCACARHLCELPSVPHSPFDFSRPARSASCRACYKLSYINSRVYPDITGRARRHSWFLTANFLPAFVQKRDIRPLFCSCAPADEPLYRRQSISIACLKGSPLCLCVAVQIILI